MPLSKLYFIGDAPICANLRSHATIFVGFAVLPINFNHKHEEMHFILMFLLESSGYVCSRTKNALINNVGCDVCVRLRNKTLPQQRYVLFYALMLSSIRIFNQKTYNLSSKSVSHSKFAVLKLPVFCFVIDVISALILLFLFVPIKIFPSKSK